MSRDPQAPGRPATAPVASDGPDLPPELRHALEVLGTDPCDLVERSPGRPRPVRHLVGGGVIVDVARDATGRHLNGLEVFGRRWAASHGLPTARLHAADPHGAWLVGEFVASGEPGGPDYVAAALEVARGMAALPAPRGGPAPVTWRASRRTLPVRVARLVAAGLPLQRWRAARAAALALPDEVTAHGDYYFRNVLWAGADEGVRLVDWEYLGRAPRHADPLRLWSCMKAEADRNLLVEELLRVAPAGERRPIGLLAHWLGLRLFAENVSAPRAHRNPEDARHARVMMREGRDLAVRLGAWPV